MIFALEHRAITAHFFFFSFFFFCRATYLDEIHVCIQTTVALFFSQRFFAEELGPGERGRGGGNLAFTVR